jgi:RNA polymerase sigma-70 factor, ECF subfamily
MNPYSDPLLHDVRRGDRHAFVRYYDLYSARVYGLVRWLLGDPDEAVSVTAETFAAAYKRVLLGDGARDLQASTYAEALAVSRARLDARVAHDSACPVTAVADGPVARRRDDLPTRFEQALRTLEFGHRAVLLLHDVNGLGHAELAAVFAISEESASALLFRAREQFRDAFADPEPASSAAACRLAELAAAGAVGSGLPANEVHRLREHAGYCRPCRRTMKGWRVGAIGLALVLDEGSLPQALEVPPVFGAAKGLPASLDASPTRAGALARIGRALKSRAVAYAVAAALAAACIGLATQLPRTTMGFVVLRSGVPYLPLATQPSEHAGRHPANTNGQTAKTATGGQGVAPKATSEAEGSTAASYVADAGSSGASGGGERHGAVAVRADGAKNQSAPAGRASQSGERGGAGRSRRAGTSHPAGSDRASGAASHKAAGRLRAGKDRTGGSGRGRARAGSATALGDSRQGHVGPRQGSHGRAGQVGHARSRASASRGHARGHAPARASRSGRRGRH